mgnify:CR=1 FL=1
MDGEVLYRAAYGLANRDFGVQNRIDTKFNLGSMNKMFTAVAIAQLVERGVLAVDDPLSRFVDFPDRESAEKIRIEHLLTHTAGLGGYFSEAFWEASRDRFRTVDEMMELASEETLQFEPGTRWSYSNTGMLVLGAGLLVSRLMACSMLRRIGRVGDRRAWERSAERASQEYCRPDDEVTS